VEPWGYRRRDRKSIESIQIEQSSKSTKSTRLSETNPSCWSQTHIDRWFESFQVQVGQVRSCSSIEVWKRKCQLAASLKFKIKSSYTLSFKEGRCNDINTHVTVCFWIVTQFYENWKLYLSLDTLTRLLASLSLLLCFQLACLQVWVFSFVFILVITEIQSFFSIPTSTSTMLVQPWQRSLQWFRIDVGLNMKLVVEVGWVGSGPRNRFRRAKRSDLVNSSKGVNFIQGDSFLLRSRRSQSCCTGFQAEEGIGRRVTVDIDDSVSLDGHMHCTMSIPHL